MRWYWLTRRNASSPRIRTICKSRICSKCRIAAAIVAWLPTPEYCIRSAARCGFASALLISRFTRTEAIPARLDVDLTGFYASGIHRGHPKLTRPSNRSSKIRLFPKLALAGRVWLKLSDPRGCRRRRRPHFRLRSKEKNQKNQSDQTNLSRASRSRHPPGSLAYSIRFFNTSG